MNRYSSPPRACLLALSLCALAFSDAARCPAAPALAKGADVGWLTEMEAVGHKFYDRDGTPRDLLGILKGYGLDAIRLRVWVHPDHGWCGKDDVIRQAARARKLGFRIMIDFHYSNSWADPGKQTKPAAWKGHDLARLKKDVVDHTVDVLVGLKAAGVTPEWVQVGNETNGGMLWPEGGTKPSAAAFAALVTSGYDAVKSVFPDAKVIVHLAKGYDNRAFRGMFDALVANGAKFDVIGMSLYPSTSADPTGSQWPKLTEQCLANMNDMVARYHKDVCVCEVGMAATQPQATREMLADLLKKTASVADGRGLGVFYWEPEAYDWKKYAYGAWGENGRPTAAMDAFLVPLAPAPASPTP